MKPLTASILVVNIRGTINTPAPMKQTLKQLHLSRRHRATIIPDNQVYRGMLRAVKDYVSWCPIDAPFMVKILEKRARKEGGKPITKDDLKKLGYKSFIDLAKALEKGRASLNRLKSLKPSFTLAPPKGGFKRSIRRPYHQGGLLAENPDLPKLVEAML